MAWTVEILRVEGRTKIAVKAIWNKGMATEMDHYGYEVGQDTEAMDAFIAEAEQVRNGTKAGDLTAGEVKTYIEDKLNEPHDMDCACGQDDLHVPDAPMIPGPSAPRRWWEQVGPGRWHMFQTNDQ